MTYRFWIGSNFSVVNSRLFQCHLFPYRTCTNQPSFILKGHFTMIKDTPSAEIWAGTVLKNLLFFLFLLLEIELHKSCYWPIKGLCQGIVLLGCFVCFGVRNISQFLKYIQLFHLVGLGIRNLIKIFTSGRSKRALIKELHRPFQNFVLSAVLEITARLGAPGWLSQ